VKTRLTMSAHGVGILNSGDSHNFRHGYHQLKRCTVKEEAKPYAEEALVQCVVAPEGAPDVATRDGAVAPAG
jgi:hypothetical protein